MRWAELGDLKQLAKVGTHQGPLGVGTLASGQLYKHQEAIGGC